ncbi:GNAT family N-acetyltransferase [Streptomyces sp. NBC_01136]|uniref:GNAT family N-acetyltransferase n=1 Tax=unclassified Streptomyces TaxID=2593676 RepID=UPI00324C3B54|nr:GNAT family N-acetyltransferase [Streptomyces sp. NBC_01136]
MRNDLVRNDLALRVHERLSASGGLRAVGFGEGRRFGLWDLASLAEGALGECVDPDSLTVTREKELRVRLGSHGRAHRHEDEYRRRYWIWPQHEHAPGPGPGSAHASGPLGTIAVDTWPAGAGALRVWSLYVHPVARRCGLAAAALGTVYDACRAEGLHGFRLDAHWTWQNSVRYYLARGLWVTSWKHALGFARLSYLPRYEVRESEDEGELTFLVAGSGGSAQWVPLLVAGDQGGRLRLRETAEYAGLPDERAAVRLYARSTLALHLAVRGRPLIRGEEEWADAGDWCDIGEPEGLAYRIGAFERTARDDGWRVDSPYGDGGAFGWG